MLSLPYMGGYPNKVYGKYSTQPTTFGVIGMFKESNKSQSLQNLVIDKVHTKTSGLENDANDVKHGRNTERKLLGAVSKTHIPALHYGMVPFAGRFMSNVGDYQVYGKHSDDAEHHEHHEHHDKKHSKN